MIDKKDKQTILVVDDASENIDILSAVLRPEYKVKVALNGKRALKIAAGVPRPDMILLDIMMPGMDGYEVCQRLKSNPATHSIPVIFITAKSQEEDEKKGLELGAEDYITKPINPAIVLVRVRTHLALYDQNRALEHMVEVRTKELQDAQKQLIQAEKMESIGRLAAGVAHEVKNPLAIIQMGTDFLSQEMPADETINEVINDINDAVRRADNVIKGLLDFSRDKELRLVAGNINEVIESSLHLVAHEMRQRNIEVRSELAEELPAINLDANKMQQVLINLFMNSAHAIDRDGKLIVTSRLKTLDSSVDLAYDHENRFKLGEKVLWVKVEDTGTGISDEAGVKIFDPFYTTKPVGEGTGLGLSVSQNIIKLHEGSIDIHNRKLGGAVVVMMFKLSGGEKQ
jgi:signal transduction histidine kinase